MRRFNGKTTVWLTALLLPLLASPLFGVEETLGVASASSSPSPRHTAATAQGKKGLSLKHCIETALANNPEIAALRWDIGAAEARFDAARSVFWPQVGVEGGYQRFVDGQRLIAARYNGELGVFDNDLFRGDLIARINLYAGGRMTHEMGAAEKLSDAERKKLIRTREDLVYNVATTYYAILGQQHVISALEFSQQALEKSLERASLLYDARKLAKVDVLRTEVRLTDLTQNLIRERNTLAVQRRILFSLMGYDNALEEAQFVEQLEFSAVTPVDVGPLLDTALKKRSDFLAAKDRLAAQDMMLKAARAAYRPNVNLVASYGVRNAPSPEDEAKSTKTTEDVGSVGVVLSVPLFDGGVLDARVREQTALLAAARQRLRKLELLIRQEVETAVLDVRSNAARKLAMEKAIEQAKESFRIESLKYEMGKGSLTDVLDAQAAQLLAETNYCRACVAYHTATARLRLATGGDP